MSVTSSKINDEKWALIFTKANESEYQLWLIYTVFFVIIIITAFKLEEPIGSWQNFTNPFIAIQGWE